MEAFELSRLLEQRRGSDQLFLEFLNVGTLSAGIYELAVGTVDPQKPHTEDEIYYVLEGRGQVRVGEENRTRVLGSIVFVEAGVEHRFHSIVERLTLLVMFAPARGSRALAATRGA